MPAVYSLGGFEMKKRTIIKIITSSVTFTALSGVNVYLSAVMHRFFAKESIVIGTFSENIAVIRSSPACLKIFFCFEIFIILGLILSCISRVSEYKSGLKQVAAGIYIPEEAGEKQYGSARFMTKEEIDKTFDSGYIKTSNSIVRMLVKKGYSDLEFMRKDLIQNEDRTNIETGDIE